MQIRKQVNPFAGTLIGDGSAVVATAGSRVQLSTSEVPPITAVLIVAKAANAGTIWVGGSTVAAGRGRPLVPLQSEWVSINSLTKVYLDADTNGDGVTYLWVL